MTYDEFKEKLLGEIGERLGKPAVKIIAVTKNNNVQKDAVTLSDCEAELNPVVYLDDLYKECMAGKKISEESLTKRWRLMRRKYCRGCWQR